MTCSGHMADQQWQVQAEGFLNYLRDRMELSCGAASEICAKRAIGFDTAMRCNILYNDEDVRFPGSAWRYNHDVTIRKGIVVPIRRRYGIVGISVLVENGEGKCHWEHVPMGVQVPFVAMGGRNDNVFLVDSTFDAVLLSQELYGSGVFLSSDTSMYCDNETKAFILSAKRVYNLNSRKWAQYMPQYQVICEEFAYNTFLEYHQEVLYGYSDCLVESLPDMLREEIRENIPISKAA